MRSMNRSLAGAAILLATCGGVLGGEREDVATLTKLGPLLKAGDTAGIVASADEILGAAKRSFGETDPTFVKIVGIVANACKDEGRYDLAEPLHVRALETCEKHAGPQHPDTAIALNNLAALYDARGQLARAEPLYKRALAIDEKTAGPDHPTVALTLNNLAALLFEQGQYDDAGRLFTRALAIQEKTRGPTHPETARTLDNLAELHRAQGRLAEAEPLRRRALAIWEATLGPDHPVTATSLVGLGLLSMARGRTDEADKLLQRALEILDRSYRPDHPLIAAALNGLAGLRLEQGRHADAERLLTRALTCSEQALGSDQRLTIAIRGNLWMALAAGGRWDAAVAEVDRARRAARAYVARVLPALPGEEQVAFLRNQDAGDLHAALTLGLLERRSPGVATLSAGWLANGKAVAQEATSQRIVLARQGGDPRTAAATATLAAVRAELAKAGQSALAGGRATVDPKTLARLRAEEHRLIEEIGGQLATLSRPEPWVDVESIRRGIEPGSVLVDICRFRVADFSARGAARRWQQARYAAWTVPAAGRGDVTIVDLGSAEEIDAAVAAYREALERVQRNGFERGQATSEEELKATAAPLATRVLQPIMEAVGDATDIILSPDGSLWLVPWQAMPLTDGSYAIEKFTIRTVTSAREFVMSDAVGGRSDAVVVADPAFDAMPAVDGVGKPADKTGRSFARLPNTRTEAAASRPVLAKLTGGEPVVLLGADANETNVKRLAVRPATLVVATHAFFKPDQQPELDEPFGSVMGLRRGSRRTGLEETTTADALEDPLLRCGLALAGANVGGQATGADDGILTGAEIVGLDLLGTDLVVLSACETGVGRIRNGEGVAGLRQAFQIAGAKSVVATLWQVPDAESAQIMQSFYANMAQGQPTARALREAQLAFIKARREDRTYESAHPYFWAAYGVTGN